MPGPDQAAVPFYDAILAYYGCVIKNLPQEGLDEAKTYYQAYLDGLGEFIDIMVKGGAVSVWFPENVPLLHPLFHIPPENPSEKKPFYFDIGDAVQLLLGYAIKMPRGSQEKAIADAFATGIAYVLEGTVPYPEPETLLCVNSAARAQYLELRQRQEPSCQNNGNRLPDYSM